MAYFIAYGFINAIRTLWSVGFAWGRSIHSEEVCLSLYLQHSPSMKRHQVGSVEVFEIG